MSEHTPLPWRVGTHYRIHLYSGEIPLGTTLTVNDAAYIVLACNAYPKLVEQVEVLTKALEAVEELDGKTLLGPRWDEERHHEIGAAKAFNQAADIAKSALNLVRGE